MAFSPKLVMLTNTDMKVVNSSYISPFGGLNFVLEEFDKLNIGKLLNAHLPDLPSQSRYDWRDLLYSFWSIYFCGGDCIEDLSANLKLSFQSPFLKTPSPDSVLKRMKELALPSQIFDTVRGKRKHEFSINKSLNELNLKILKDRINKQNGPIVLDYDNTLLYSKKADAKMTYKKQFGYAPGVGIIGDNIVYVENRNGNSAAPNLQQDTLERMFTLLKEQGVKPDIFRADGGSYKLSTISTISNHVDKLYVRARMSEPLIEAIQSIESWQRIEIDGQEVFRGSVRFTPFKSTAKREKKEYLLKEYRMVVTKQKRDDGQINIFSGEANNYHPIITNDLEMSNDEVVFFYNKRGAIEKEFDILKNDFGWDNMPFSHIEQNNVSLIFTAICRNLYAHIIETFSNRFNGLSAKYRIKKFIFRFISIPARWIRQSRYWKLKLYGQIAFKT